LLALRNRSLWLDGLVIVLALAGGLFVAGGLAILPNGQVWGFDFDAYYRAALRLAETGTPYSAETLAGPFSPGPAGLYLYSPLLALLLQPLTELAQATATAWWYVLRAGLLLATCLMMPVPARLRLAMIGVAGLSQVVLVDLGLGNVSLIVTFLTVAAWRFLDRPLGGLAVAAALFLRPTMGLLLIWWAARRRFAPAVWAVVGAGSAVAISALLIGAAPYFDYLNVLRNLTGVTGVPKNVDLASSALALGASPDAAQLILLASYALAAGAALLSLRRDRELSFVVIAMATLFAAPLMWDHYLTQLLVTSAFMASRGRWWALPLPLLTWLPQVFLPIPAVIGLLLPFLAPARGEPALAAWRRRHGQTPESPGAAANAP
jgi:hypothetical protein